MGFLWVIFLCFWAGRCLSRCPALPPPPRDPATGAERGAHAAADNCMSGPWESPQGGRRSAAGRGRRRPGPRGRIAPRRSHRRGVGRPSATSSRPRSSPPDPRRSRRTRWRPVAVAPRPLNAWNDFGRAHGTLPAFGLPPSASHFAAAICLRTVDSRSRLIRGRVDARGGRGARRRGRGRVCDGRRRSSRGRRRPVDDPWKVSFPWTNVTAQTTIRGCGEKGVSQPSSDLPASNDVGRARDNLPTFGLQSRA